MESERRILYEQEWNNTWESFLRALRSHDDFDPVYWLYRLVTGGLRYLYFKIGIHHLGSVQHWRSTVPIFGMGLICTVLMSYVFSLRNELANSWCNIESVISQETSPEQQRRIVCPRLYIHDGIIAYLGFMIMFHFISACWRSPGVVLSSEYEGIDGHEEDPVRIPPFLKWKSADARGGCFGWNPTLNIVAERNLVALYTASIPSSTETDIFPSLEWTYCDKCKILRPPRCHHSSVCNRCILEFDHHCVWLNNCIGKNNYRDFVLLLFFLTIGCIYGIAILCRHFFGPLRHQIHVHGWHLMYDQGTGFLNISPLHILLGALVWGELDPESIIKLVFPLLVSVGIIQVVFLSSHVRYILAGRTTLEHKILLDRQMDMLTHHRVEYEVPPNPFDRGWVENLRATLGRNFLLTMFLPLQVVPTSIPHQKKST